MGTPKKNELNQTIKDQAQTIKELREDLEDITQIKNKLCKQSKIMKSLIVALFVQFKIDAFEAQARALRANERYKFIHQAMNTLEIDIPRNDEQ